MRDDLSKADLPFTIRTKFPDGYKLIPHFHLPDENVVVLQGTMMMGQDEKNPSEHRVVVDFVRIFDHITYLEFAWRVGVMSDVSLILRHNIACQERRKSIFSDG